jgi:hypothetical protein
MERQRLDETEEQPVIPQNGGQVDELVDLSGGTQRSGQWSGRSGEGEAEEWSGGCDAARERERNELGFGGGEGRPGPAAAYMREVPRRIQRSGGAAPHQRSGGGRAGVGFWWADSRTCHLVLLSGRYRAANFRAVLRAGPPCWGCGPGTKRTSAGPALSPIDRA